VLDGERGQTGVRDVAVTAMLLAALLDETFEILAMSRPGPWKRERTRDVEPLAREAPGIGKGGRKLANPAIHREAEERQQARHGRPTACVSFMRSSSHVAAEACRGHDVSMSTSRLGPAPAQARKARVVAVGRDPLAAGLDGEGGEVGVGHEVAARIRVLRIGRIGWVFGATSNDGRYVKRGVGGCLFPEVQRRPSPPPRSLISASGEREVGKPATRGVGARQSGRASLSSREGPYRARGSDSRRGSHVRSSRKSGRGRPGSTLRG